MIVILNNSAGGPTAGGALRAEVELALRGQGLEPQVWLAEGGEQIETLAKKAAASAAEIVVAGGGDGTINGVASALIGSEKRLGILPLGTLNHFARDLGIPVLHFKRSRTRFSRS